MPNPAHDKLLKILGLALHPSTGANEAEAAFRASRSFVERTGGALDEILAPKVTTGKDDVRVQVLTREIMRARDREAEMCRSMLRAEAMIRRQDEQIQAQSRRENEQCEALRRFAEQFDVVITKTHTVVERMNTAEEALEASQKREANLREQLARRVAADDAGTDAPPAAPPRTPRIVYDDALHARIAEKYAAVPVESYGVIAPSLAAEFDLPLTASKVASFIARRRKAGDAAFQAVRPYPTIRVKTVQAVEAVQIVEAVVPVQAAEPVQVVEPVQATVEPVQTVKPVHSAPSAPLICGLTAIERWAIDDATHDEDGVIAEDLHPAIERMRGAPVELALVARYCTLIRAARMAHARRAAEAQLPKAA